MFINHRCKSDTPSPQLDYLNAHGYAVSKHHNYIAIDETTGNSLLQVGVPNPNFQEKFDYDYVLCMDGNIIEFSALERMTGSVLNCSLEITYTVTKINTHANEFLCNTIKDALIAFSYQYNYTQETVHSVNVTFQI